MNIKHYSTFTLAALLLFTSGFAQADSSAFQLNVEGNATCSSLSTNSILQARDTTYAPVGGFDSVAGSDGQVFQYTLSSTNGVTNNTIVWSVTTPDPDATPSIAKPVNYIILKLAGNAGGRAVYYSNPGVYTDSGISTTHSIASVSFCYGLTAPFNAVSPELLICDSSLDNTLCSGDSTKIVTVFDEGAPDDNWNIQTCMCAPTFPTDPVFTECNPALKAGTPGIPGPCTNSDGPLLYLPATVEVGKDPGTYYCVVINGTKKCYKK